jgi:hypothetical protein
MARLFRAKLISRRSRGSNRVLQQRSAAIQQQMTMVIDMVQLILAGRTAGRSSSFIAENEAACKQTVEDVFQVP